MLHRCSRPKPFILESKKLIYQQNLSCLFQSKTLNQTST